ncbi:phosphate ABC transporter substrate-binding protein PstS [Limnoglobus roseus]|uniref:Phosphate-binding protein n=1 Tax=Limnoglobus roseus TaxID=2598579 RepID=A0A5C1A3M0_9BACT|nr:phosphate ABC transporter substrate-binding protein PstS [Limnoglobus roseus]QEL13180.1 phosphate ABC transporter substrate-binding protein PstS [Limnoglobus roseus]
MPPTRREFARWLMLAPLAAAGCVGDGTPVRVHAGGSTFVDLIMQAWAREYRREKRTEIDYIKSGSGKGISDVVARTVDFGCTDAPMSRKELAAARAEGGDVLHLPVTIGAVAVIFNAPGVEALTLTGPVLADIYLQNINRWDDPAVAALNPGVPLPTADIVPVRRAESSGTTGVFSEYLSKVSPAFHDRVGATKEMQLPGGTGQSGNDGIAGFVKNNPGAIGYVELAYAARNAIPIAALKNRAGHTVRPTAEGVTAAAATAALSKPTAEPYSLHDLAYSLTDADGAASYPIVGVSYAILFAKQPPDKGPAVVDFLKWVVTDGQKLARDLHYGPLPEAWSLKATAKLDAVTFL